MKNEFKDDFRGGLGEDLRRIAGMIANLPDREPPGDREHTFDIRLTRS